MHCTHCGAFVPDSMNFCQSCGAPVAAAPVMQEPQFNQQAPNYQSQPIYGQNQPYQNPQTYGQNPYGQPQGQMMSRTKADFNRHPNVRKYKGNLTGACCILYFCAGITLLLNVLLAGNILGLLDVSIILGLALGVHLGKSRVCAIILCCYAAFNMIFVLVTMHTFGGWIIAVGAGYALIITCMYQSSWKKFQQTGIVD